MANVQSLATGSGVATRQGNATINGLPQFKNSIHFISFVLPSMLQLLYNNHKRPNDISFLSVSDGIRISLPDKFCLPKFIQQTWL